MKCVPTYVRCVCELSSLLTSVQIAEELMKTVVMESELAEHIAQKIQRYKNSDSHKLKVIVFHGQDLLPGATVSRVPYVEFCHYTYTCQYHFFLLPVCNDP